MTCEGQCTCDVPQRILDNLPRSADRFMGVSSINEGGKITAFIDVYEGPRSVSAKIAVDLYGWSAVAERVQSMWARYGTGPFPEEQRGRSAP